METKKIFNLVTQIAIPTLTIGAQIAIALKAPQWGLIVNLTAQPFWLYSAWRSYSGRYAARYIVIAIGEPGKWVF